MSGDIEDVVLGTIRMHMDKISKLEILELLMAKFEQNEVFEAHTKLSDYMGKDKPKNRKDGNERTGLEAQVNDLVKEMEAVDKGDSAPKIVVAADMIHRIPMKARMDPSEVCAVNVRLEQLEEMMKKMIEKVDNVHGEVSQAVHKEVQQVVQKELGQQVQRQVQQQFQEQVQQQVQHVHQQPSFSAVVSGSSSSDKNAPAGQTQVPLRSAGRHGGAQGHVAPPGGVHQGVGHLLGARGRTFSVTSRGSVKRGVDVDTVVQGSENQEGEFQEVNNRRRQPRKMNYGKNTAEFDIEGAEAAPYEVFIGNTHPKATEAIIADVLAKCAQTLPDKPSLKILHVKCLTNLDRDPNPRTKCWRVQVPYSCKSIIENDELYPVGWSHRKFFPARQPKLNQNKRFHQDPVVQYLNGNTEVSNKTA